MILFQYPLICTILYTKKKYYKIETKERYLVQTQLQTKSSGVTLPEVHGAKKY